MPGRLVVDLDALAANYAQFRAASNGRAGAEVGAVVKADAYGLGVEAVSRRLCDEGCRSFFVATADEGARLRRVLDAAAASAAVDIYVFEGATPDNVATLVAAALIPIINHAGQLERWRPERQRPIAVHVDTGMARLGFPLETTARDFRGFDVCLLLSHLACADEAGHPRSALQVQRFAEIVARFPGVRTSLGNSAAWLTGAPLQGDLGRPGIGLYGSNPFADRPNPLACVARLEARVLQVRRLPRGTPVGYGAAAITHADTDTAVLGIGYADGLPRAFSNRGAVAIHGRRCPILGRVSMDLTVVDVSACAEAGERVVEGDSAECFGPTIPVDEAAGWADTLAYEVLTRIGPRVTREYTAGQRTGR